MSNSVLTSKVKRKVAKVGSADILVGIPSLNNEKTIGFVLKAVRLGLAKYFPNHKTIIVNSDCGSTDKTASVVQKEISYKKEMSTILINQEIHPFFKHPEVRPVEILSIFKEAPGKGKAFRRIFEIASRLNVKACAVVDSDLRSITPEWIQLLIGPILYKNYGFVTPYYIRHKYDATITNSLVYPLNTALYGLDIRQPIGGEFGFCRELANLYIEDNIWNTDIAYYGIDIFMTTTALVRGFKFGQVFLGAKLHDPKDPAFSLGPMFRQVIGTMFDLMKRNENIWLKAKGKKEVKIYGFRTEVIPELFEVNEKALILEFKAGFQKYQKLIKKILKKQNYQKIKDDIQEKIPIPAHFWPRIVYDFAVFYNKTEQKEKSEILKAILPFYFGRTFSFIEETKGISYLEAEKKIRSLCSEFIRQKPYLIKRWKEEIGR